MRLKDVKMLWISLLKSVEVKLNQQLVNSVWSLD